MSNKYIDFGVYATPRMSSAVKTTKYLQRPTNEKEQKRKNRIEDISENPRKIWANNAYVQKVRLMQDAQNYRNEVDRLRSMVSDNRIPANRRQLYRGRLDAIENHLRRIHPMIAQHGEYHAT